MVWRSWHGVLGVLDRKSSSSRERLGSSSSAWHASTGAPRSGAASPDGIARRSGRGSAADRSPSRMLRTQRAQVQGSVSSRPAGGGTPRPPAVGLPARSSRGCAVRADPACMRAARQDHDPVSAGVDLRFAGRGATRADGLRAECQRGSSDCTLRAASASSGQAVAQQLGPGLRPQGRASVRAVSVTAQRRGRGVRRRKADAGAGAHLPDPRGSRRPCALRVRVQPERTSDPGY